MRRPGKGGATKHTMNTKTYPRTNDRRTIYLNTVIDNPCIEVGDYTIYNDFVNDPTEFEKNNVLYHYPINKDRLVIGKFCSIACGARFLFNSANHTLGSLANYTFPLFFEEWELDRANVAAAWDNKGDIVIGNDDSIVEFEITNNRPDCYSLIGLARETAAAFNVPMKHHEPVVKGGAEGDLGELLDVDVQADDLCPRYTARMVRNVKIAPSPKWMRQRLRSAGIRPINNIVDITNYVMIEYGQPMHAFDYKCLSDGRIVVRRARNGESIQTLDGVITT